MPVTPEGKSNELEHKQKKHTNKTYFKNGEGGRNSFWNLALCLMIDLHFQLTPGKGAA